MNFNNNVKNKKAFDRAWPFLLCIVLAFLVWLFVMYVRAPEYEREYEDIKITTVNLPAKFSDYKIEVYEDEISATFRGTNMNLAKCDMGDIVAMLDLSSVAGVGLVSIPVTYVYPDGVALTCKDSISVLVNVTAPQSRYFTEIPVIIEYNGKRGADVLEGYILSAHPKTVEAYITSVDSAFKNMDSSDVVAIADISSLNITAPGTYSSVKLDFISERGVELNDPNIYIEVVAELKGQ